MQSNTTQYNCVSAVCAYVPYKSGFIYCIRLINVSFACSRFSSNPWGSFVVGLNVCAEQSRVNCSYQVSTGTSKRNNKAKRDKQH